MDKSFSEYDEFQRSWGTEFAPTWRDVVKNDNPPPPDFLWKESSPNLGDGKIPPERYTSHEFHRREVDKIWKRTWQPTCREEEIPEVGDHFVYDVAGLSFLIVRNTPESFKAFWNVCPHRGRILVDGSGEGAHNFTCGYHAWSFSLDGELVYYPGAWDFPDVTREKCSLREVKVETWGGFVFINPDRNAISLAEHMGSLTKHFERWPLDKRHGIIHVRKVVNANWKVGMEAFLEAYHLVATHPELLETCAEHADQYDVWDESPAYFSRLAGYVGFPSHHYAKGTPESAIKSAWEQLASMRYSDELTAPGAVHDRATLAEWRRKTLTADTGADYSILSDSEIMDGVQYWLFPNFCPWYGESYPLSYIFRPNADSPDTCYMDVWFLVRNPDNGPAPAPGKLIELGADDKFQDAIGLLGLVLDQDGFNMPQVQRGLRNWPGDPEGLTISRYQESRVRFFHQCLMKVLNGA